MVEGKDETTDFKFSTSTLRCLIIVPGGAYNESRGGPGDPGSGLGGPGGVF